MNALGGSLARKGIARRTVGTTYHHVLRTGCGLNLFSGPCGCYSIGHTGGRVFAGRRHTITHGVTSRDLILLGGRNGILPLTGGNAVTIMNPLTSDHDGVPNA